MSWRHNSNSYPYICDHAGHVPNTPDIGLLLEFKMATGKTEAAITFERLEITMRFQLTPTFSIRPDLDMALPISPEIS